MRPALDSIYFDDDSFTLEVKTLKRSFIQRSAAGLDGQLAIDMGLRGRKLVQTGQLRAKNTAELQQKINSISELIDGQLHSLKCPDGQTLNNLIVEEFQTDAVIQGGAYVSCAYRITYTKQD